MKKKCKIFFPPLSESTYDNLPLKGCYICYPCYVFYPSLSTKNSPIILMKIHLHRTVLYFIHFIPKRYFFAHNLNHCITHQYHHHHLLLMVAKSPDQLLFLLLFYACFGHRRHHHHQPTTISGGYHQRSTWKDFKRRSIWVLMWNQTGQPLRQVSYQQWYHHHSIKHRQQPQQQQHNNNIASNINSDYYHNNVAVVVVIGQKGLGFDLMS